MTDFSLVHKTSASDVESIAASASSAKLTNASKSIEFLVDEEEDYTIKCICGFQDDDGNTVFCERCETWQHIVCYYYSREGTIVDVRSIDHNCADCEPRELDAKGATERQSNKRREAFDPRKVKKATTKGHKKKSNATIANGGSHDPHERNSRSPKDQVPPQRIPKKSHKLSGPINLPLPLLSSAPQQAPVKRSASSSRIFHSPTETQHFQSHNGCSFELYSREFLHLYDEDPGDAPMNANLFNDINITRSLSSWTCDVESLREAAHGLSPQEVFLRCGQPLDSMNLPCLRKAHKEDTTFSIDGKHARWRYLMIESMTPKEAIVGELRGKIGHKRDYVQDPLNRWDYLRHPLPFVFFHPKLPIYIDTRHEGTICRYLRRSCRPNLSMKTILENGSDYHFCFVAKHDLEAGTELTIPWVLDEHIRNFLHPHRNEDTKQDDAEDYVIDWASKVLADFGGCACEAPSQCTLARFDRRRGGPISNRNLPSGKPAKGRNGYSNKPSPPSTGYATNSRAGSEFTKHQEDEEQDDTRSTSGSMRSKPQSRDLTPSHRISGDIGYAPGVELSDRDKRKIAAMEKTFEQLEAHERPVQKKKKRNSGGSTLATPSAGISKQLSLSDAPPCQESTPSHHPNPNHLEASESAAQDYVPSSSRRLYQQQLPNEIPTLDRHNYVSSGVQTNLGVSEDWYESTFYQIPRRKHHISLTKRLLLRCQKDRQRLEAERSTSRGILHGKAGCDLQSLSYSEIEGEEISRPIDTVKNNLSKEVEMENITHHSDQPEDIDMKEISHDPVADPGSVPSSLPVQKPRPPDQEKGIATLTIITEIHDSPRTPTPSQLPQTISARNFHINGFHPNEMLVQSPSVPSITHETTLESFSAHNRSSVPSLSPLMQISSSQLTIPPATSCSPVHSTPVKKKISVGEYLFRRKAESQSTSEKSQNFGSVFQQNSPRAAPALKGHSTVAADDGTDANTAIKDLAL